MHIVWLAKLLAECCRQLRNVPKAKFSQLYFLRWRVNGAEWLVAAFGTPNTVPGFWRRHQEWKHQVAGGEEHHSDESVQHARRDRSAYDEAIFTLSSRVPM